MRWRVSSHCNGGECIEVGACSHGAAVRDSGLGDSSPVLAFGAEEWAAFTAAVKQDEGTPWTSLTP
jgi:hypothetical protein